MKSAQPTIPLGQVRPLFRAASPIESVITAFAVISIMFNARSPRRRQDDVIKIALRAVGERVQFASGVRQKSGRDKADGAFARRARASAAAPPEGDEGSPRGASRRAPG
jgi:hypothetical protein